MVIASIGGGFWLGNYVSLTTHSNALGWATFAVTTIAGFIITGWVFSKFRDPLEPPTGRLRCDKCRGTGKVTLTGYALPCKACHGKVMSDKRWPWNSVGTYRIRRNTWRGILSCRQQLSSGGLVGTL